MARGGKFLRRMMVLLAAAGALAACETVQQTWDGFSTDVSPGDRAQAAAMDPVALRIAESADKASAALQDLARVEETRRPPAPEPPTTSNDELNALVTIDWTGGAEELVRNLSVRLKYDVVVVGNTPVVPVVVNIHQRDRTVLEALRNIGEQATEFLDLAVDPQNHKIEIRYKAPEPTRS